MKRLLKYLKDSLINIIKGVLMGVANVIPGVSGGTMAVSLGIYDKFIAAITNLFKRFKQSIAFLIPIIIGMGVGIVGFAYLIEYLLEKQTLPTDLAFIGLILGGVPLIFRGLRDKQKEKGIDKFKIRPQDVIAFVLFFALAVGLPLFKESTDTLQQLEVNAGNAFMLFFGGIIAAATMVVPGVSGSMVMMIFGFYYGVLNLVTGFFNAVFALDFAGALKLCILIIPFGVGVLLGIFLIAKLIDYLFRNHGIVTYFAIFGLIIASPFAIIYNTGVFSKAFSPLGLLVGIILMLVFGYGTYYIGTKE
jgi:putative membrane protein